jgi:Flp pilus assembly protein TadG
VKVGRTQRDMGETPMLRKKIAGGRRGSEVIELAFLLLPLMWLTFGAIDYGYYFYIEHNLQGAAREGARAGVPQGVPDYVAAAEAGATKIMTNAGFKAGTYTIGTKVENIATNDALTVTVEMNYTAIGIPPARVPATKVKGTASMMFEGLSP